MVYINKGEHECPHASPHQTLLEGNQETGQYTEDIHSNKTSQLDKDNSVNTTQTHPHCAENTNDKLQYIYQHFQENEKVY